MFSDATTPVGPVAFGPVRQEPMLPSVFVTYHNSLYTVGTLQHGEICHYLPGKTVDNGYRPETSRILQMW